QDARWAASSPTSDGDVLQLFEAELAKPTVTSVSPMDERARGVVEEFEELLPVEALTILEEDKPDTTTKTATAEVKAPPSGEPQPVADKTATAAKDATAQAKPEQAEVNATSPTPAAAPEKPAEAIATT